jgi:hypothetical protein
VPRPGSTSSRGYDRRHQLLRRMLEPQVRTGRVACARCGLLIRRGQAWDLGHTDDRTSYSGPEHATCNRQAGAAEKARRHADPTPKPRTRW